MTISRMQQPRQLYGLGSLVKKITRPIKKIVKSPIGKAALLGAATYGLGGGFGSAGFQKATLLGRLGLGRFAGAGAAPGSFRAAQEIGVRKGLLSKLLGGAKDFAIANPGQAALLGLGAAGVAAPFFFGKKEDEEEVVEDPFSVTPSSISDIVAQARRRDPSLRFLPPTASAQPGFFTAAEGGTPREMFSSGSGRMRETYRMLEKAIADNDMDSIILLQSILRNEFGQNLAKGGIADLPKVRMLEGGMPEIDYRESGGFVPVGKKEKADDVPAMLSKNEFVMTADAVRGMGDGSVEKGAQRMYDQMKQLENRVV